MNTLNKIAIFGGSFNPIHNAHIELSLCALKECSLDLILFMPTIRPVHKILEYNTSYEDRMNMTGIAIKNFPQFILSDFEKNINYKPYSYNIVSHLKKEHRFEDLYFIIGYDSLYEIETWGHYRDFLKMVTLIVANRKIKSKNKSIKEMKKYLEDSYNAKIIILNSYEENNISSTEIRNQIHNNEVPNDLDPLVYEYILEHNLYK